MERLREARRLSEKEILIVGVGNEFRGDDGVGPFIARRLGTKNLPGNSFARLLKWRVYFEVALSIDRWL